MNSQLQTYWRDKAVLITGASSGLGRAVVEALAPYGVDFCLLSRRTEKMEELAASLKKSPSSFSIHACDVQNRREVYSVVQNFYEEKGRLDVAWVNSGISRETSFKNWSWPDVENVIDTNLKGAIYTTQACLERMAPQGGGTVVGIGSAACMRGLPTRGVYSLSKVGLEFYFESLAVELPQIQFTLIHPGFVDTPINQNNPNRFWLLTPEKAAELMIRAVAKKKRFYIYPFRMNLLFRLVRLLPLFVYQPLARKAADLSRPTAG